MAAPGAYGKPRPAVVIQGDSLNHSDPSSTIVALMTSALVDAPLLRLMVPANDDTGLRTTSQVQVNRILTLPVAKVGHTIGRLNDR